MFNEEIYKKELEILELSKNFVEKQPILNSVFGPSFWCGVKYQLEMLRKDNSGTINPVFHLILRKDEDKDFVKMKQLENYLGVIFRRSEVKQEHKNYIKKELQSFTRANSLNMIFEINVLGYLLSQFFAEKIRLYPKTTFKKNIDVIINLGKRDIYLEITALGDSDFMKKNITNALRSGKVISLLPNSDEEKDVRRIRSRIDEKEKQFIPQKPNALIIFMAGCGAESVPGLGLLKSAINQSELKNIGLVMEFGRQGLVELHKEGCDEGCFLTEEEERDIKDLFGPDKFESLVYS